MQFTLKKYNCLPLGKKNNLNANGNKNMFNVLPHWKIICKIGKMHFKTLDAEHIINPLYADFKESVHCSHTHSDNFFLGTNPSKKSITGM